MSLAVELDHATVAGALCAQLAKATLAALYRTASETSAFFSSFAPIGASVGSHASDIAKRRATRQGTIQHI